MAFRDGYQQELLHAAAVSGEEASGDAPYVDESPDELSGVVPTIARWIALLAAIVTLPAGGIAAGTIAGSYDWHVAKQFENANNGFVGGGLIVVIGGGLVALVLAVALFAMARALLARPRLAIAVLVTIGLCLGALGAVLLLGPHLVMGSSSASMQRAKASRLTDAEFSGLALLLAAILAVIAGLLTGLALAATRRRALALADTGGDTRSREWPAH